MTKEISIFATPYNVKQYVMFRKQINDYLEKHGFEAFCPKAVLFDMDGVLYDSMPNHAVSWHESMSRYGLAMRPEEAYTYEGMRGVETIKLLARRQWNRELTDKEASDMYATKAEVFSSCPVAPVMDGVKELMRKVKRAGLQIVIVTGSGQKSLLGKLEREFKGLVCADKIVTSFDVRRGKPDPEPYLCGMMKAGIEPWQGIVVENAPLGVRAGVAANLFTVAVNTGPLPDGDLTREGANLIFHDMPAFRDAWDEFRSCFNSGNKQA